MNPEKSLREFGRALAQFKQALELRAENDVIRAGCIQYFEFTFELAWKAIKAFAEDEGLSAVNSPKASLKAAFSQTWIDDEDIWLEMLDARNRMSHTYDVKDALVIYDRLPAFVAALENLLTRLQG